MKTKKMISALIIFVLLIAIATNVFAEPVITVPEKNLKLNDEFELGIDTGEPFQNVEFNLQYDKNIFKYISSSTQNVDITEQNGTLVIKPQSSSELKQYSVTLKFKVISTSSKTSNVSLNCKGTNASGYTVNLSGVKGLNIGGEVTPTTPPANEISQNKIEQPAQKVEQMPNTGSLNYIIPAIIAVLLVGVFVIYNKNKNLY